MAIEFTVLADLSSQLTNLRTNLVLEIEGIDDIFGAIDIKKYVRIGDVGLEIGDEWRIGGVLTDPNSKAVVNYDKGTSKQINQTLRPDKFEGNQTTSVVVSLTDIDEQASLLASRGGVVDDLLGRRVCIWQGFEDTGFKQDYIPLLRGRIQKLQSGPTYVSLHIVNTEENKRRKIFKARSAELQAPLSTGSLTFVPLQSHAVFASPSIAGRVNGDPETQIEFLAKVDNEYISYDAKSNSGLPFFIDRLNVVQRAIFSTDSSHAIDAAVQTAYRFKGPMLEVALRIMLSGWNGPHDSGVEVTNINVIDAANTVQNALYFEGIDVNHEYGIAEGSYVTLSGSSGNDFTNRIVTDVVKTQTASYIIVDGADLTDEISTSGTVSFRSQYDTFGIGLRMHPNEVDVAEHQDILNTFLSTFEVDLIVDEIPSAKDFIDSELYGIFACYSVLRKGRSSIGFQSSPLPGNRIFELNLNTVLNPQKLKIERDLTKYFYNAIDYQYDYDYESNIFVTKEDFESVNSKAQIIDTETPLVIRAKGVRTANDGANQSVSTATRFLARYQFGAEFVRSVEVLPSVGLAMEIGDLCLVDLAALKMTDFNQGTRSGDTKVFEIMNKNHDQETSKITIDILNTAFSADARYGRIAPSSFLDSGSTATKLNFKKSYGTPFYRNENFKWKDYIGQDVRVYAPDFSLVEEVKLLAVNDGSLAVASLGFVPGEDYIVTAPNYNTDTDPNVHAYWKAKHAYLSKDVLVASYISQTEFTVAPGDVQYFQEGQAIQILNEDFTDVGPVAEVVSIIGQTITMDVATGFVFDSTYFVRYAGFPDSGFSYRYV